jgi:hypothetical protein
MRRSTVLSLPVQLGFPGPRVAPPPSQKDLCTHFSSANSVKARSHKPFLPRHSHSGQPFRPSLMFQIAEGSLPDGACGARRLTKLERKRRGKKSFVTSAADRHSSRTRQRGRPTRAYSKAGSFERIRRMRPGGTKRCSLPSINSLNVNLVKFGDKFGEKGAHIRGATRYRL